MGDYNRANEDQRGEILIVRWLLVSFVQGRLADEMHAGFGNIFSRDCDSRGNALPREIASNHLSSNSLRGLFGFSLQVPWMNTINQ